ncbi:hypothetical protein ODS41_09845 [Pyrobaculum sp. 3827-6]|uniref:hypothetical protein n=1 Tax=Pyrobaculum sp. 3827-6 TaxID=2983604 RepID=UPI0021D9D27A|nr:hypothetical protein [Pyrobaculum sp. 3827-6]MCU7788211.1 hypothetical protein [Pyrobaculum sp. 3827-6]
MFYLYLSWGCTLGVDVKCFDTTPGGGVVWSPCSYDGDVEIEPEIPLNWGLPGREGGKFTCVAGGRVGNKTYVVFTRGVGLIMLNDSPFSDGDTVRCYCARHFCIKVAVPAAIGLASAVLVVDVDSGVGYLGIKYADPPQYSNVVFGNDGVYLALRNVWVVKEIAGDHISNCFYVVKVRLDRERLRLGMPLYNTTGSFLKIS